MHKIVPITIAAFLPLISIATQNISIRSERELRNECSYEISGVRECLQRKQEASAVELKRVEEKVRGVLAKWDENSKYMSLAKTKLATSTKAFIRYRDGHCAFAASLGGGAIGNALDMRRLACEAELNNRRAEQLRDVVSDLPLE